METKIAIFRGKQVRKIIHNDKWWFSIIDVVEVLTDSANPRRYWSDLKRNLKEKEGVTGLYDKIVQLKLMSSDGKYYETDARYKLEKKLGHPIVSNKNYLKEPENRKLLKKKS